MPTEKKSKLSQAMKNVRSKTTTSSGEKRLSNTPSRTRRRVFAKDGTGQSYVKVEKKTSAIKKKGVKKSSKPKAKALTRKRK